MHVIHISSELATIAKVGGLADVVYGMARASMGAGHRVEAFIPKYDCIHYDALQNLKVEYRDLWSFDGPYLYHNTVWSGLADSIPTLLLEPHHPQYFFSRGRIYGERDDIDRFVYFARAALEFILKSGRKPDIIHIHDWPTSLIAPLYRDIYCPLGIDQAAVVSTIHNLEHQGRCSPHNITRAGLRGEEYLNTTKLQDPTDPSLINLLKGGIEYSDWITTVSPSYEKEIITPAGGCGLHSCLIRNQKKFTGILNGIDDTYWNPATDPLIKANYTQKQAPEQKALNRTFLRKKLQLKDSSAPLVCVISRLVPQKGPELIEAALHHTLAKGGQFILLGSAPDPELDLRFKMLQKQYAKNQNIAFSLQYDEPLSHEVFASADMIVVPSLFEPCGLTQMIALRYGTIPIVRETGGLADSVFDIEYSKVPEEKRNGFSFQYPDSKSIKWALDRAFTLYEKEPNKWHNLMQRSMAANYGWSHAMQSYHNIYTQLCQKQKQKSNAR